MTTLLIGFAIGWLGCAFMKYKKCGSCIYKNALDKEEK